MLDQFNATVGIARLHTVSDHAVDAALSQIQNNLFDVGADLVTPGEGKGPDGARLTVTAAQVKWGEDQVDRLNDELSRCYRPAGRRVAGDDSSAPRAHHLPARGAIDGRTDGQAG